MRAHLRYAQACTVQHVTTWLTLSMFAVLVLRLNPGCLVGCPGSMAAGSLAMFFHLLLRSLVLCRSCIAPDMLLAGQVVCPAALKDSSSLSLMTMHSSCCEACRLLGVSPAADGCSTDFLSALALLGFTSDIDALWRP